MVCGKIRYWLGGWLEHAEKHFAHTWHSWSLTEVPCLGIAHCAPRCLLGLKRKGVGKGSYKHTLAQIGSEAYSLLASFLVSPTASGY